MTEVWLALDDWAARLQLKRELFSRGSSEAHGTVRFLCARGEGK